MPWEELLRTTGRRLSLGPACPPERLASAESELGTHFPTDLRAFLAAADGFYDEESSYGYAWDSNRIVGENARAWEDAEVPGREFLAFGSDGSGGYFYVRSDELTREIYYLGPAETEPRPVSPDLVSFWTAWLAGELTV